MSPQTKYISRVGALGLLLALFPAGCQRLAREDARQFVEY